MAITYVWSHSSIFHRKSDEWQEPITILDLDPENYPSRAIGERFRLLDPVLRVSERIVFRGSDSNLIKSLQKDTIIKNQLAGRRVGILAPLHPNKGPQFVSISGYKRLDSVPPTEAVRNIEVSGHLERSGAFVTSEGGHYRLPSGTHGARFIQLNKVLSDPTSVNRIADWIFPYMTKGMALLTDAGSVLTVLQRLQHLASQTYGWKVPVQVMDGYPADMFDLLRVISELRNLIGTNGSILLVLSVNSSDRLARMFRALAPEGSLIVALCHSRRDPPPPFVDALTTFPIERWDVDENGKCSQCDKLGLIGIDRKTFEIRPPQKIKFIKAAKTRLESKREFWLVADECDAIRLHLDKEHTQSGIPQARHHGIYIDTKCLASNSSFRSSCIQKLRQIRKPELIIIPAHSNSDVVKDLVKEAYGKTCGHILTVPLEKFARQEINLITKCSNILIADDGVVTGSTVLGLKDEIYRICQARDRLPQLNCFVLILRPRTPGLERSIQLRFYAEDKKQHLHYGELVYLPEPGRENCPWCEERAFLERFLPKLSKKAAFQVRNRMRNLEGELAIPPLFGRAKGNKKRRYTLGSFLGVSVRRLLLRPLSVLHTRYPLK
jgi:hypothetical protein